MAFAHAQKYIVIFSPPAVTGLIYHCLPHNIYRLSDKHDQRPLTLDGNKISSDIFTSFLFQVVAFITLGVRPVSLSVPTKDMNFGSITNIGIIRVLIVHQR